MDCGIYCDSLSISWCVLWSWMYTMPKRYIRGLWLLWNTIRKPYPGNLKAALLFPYCYPKWDFWGTTFVTDVLDPTWTEMTSAVGSEEAQIWCAGSYDPQLISHADMFPIQSARGTMPPTQSLRIFCIHCKRVEVGRSRSGCTFTYMDLASCHTRNPAPYMVLQGSVPSSNFGTSCLFPKLVELRS